MSWSDRLVSRFNDRRDTGGNAAGGRVASATRAATGGLASVVNGVRRAVRGCSTSTRCCRVAIALLARRRDGVFGVDRDARFAEIRVVSRLRILMRHCISLAVAFIAAVIAFRVPVSTWDKYAPQLFLIALVGLVIVLIPHVGKGVNGARRWIPLGITNMQPSEIMKLAVTIYAANYTVRKQEYMQSFAKGFLPMAFAVGLGALLLLEPDMGAFMVVAAIAMGVLFLGGVNGKLFGGLVATAIGTFTMLVWLSPWRRERIFAYLDPWDERYAQGVPAHALADRVRPRRVVRCRPWRQRREAELPAGSAYRLHPRGDRRGLGFVGVLVVILLFYWIVRRAFEIGRQALALDRTFAGLMAKGIGIWFGAQTFINMGVNLGLLPTRA